MTREEAETILRSMSLDDPVALFRTGIALLNADRPEELIATAETAARKHPRNAKLQQLLGLSARATGHSRLALRAFGNAARYAPNDALIAHSHARAALEAGRPATELFDRAALLAPQDGSVLLGRIAALAAERSIDRAIDDLATVVHKNPLWLDGQRTLARLRGQQGLDPAHSIADTIAAQPDHADLHHDLITICLEARDLGGAEAAAEGAFKRLGDQSWLIELRAHIASESGKIDQADQLFETLGSPRRIDLAAQRARHLIRANRPDHAAALIEPWIAQDEDRLLWPYLALAWRMMDDPRWSWLEGDDRLIGVHDLTGRLGNLDVLAAYLRDLHVATGTPLDQSVRGGTQTDGNLLLRDEPPIQRLRAVIGEAVAEYIAQLPATDVAHPFLLPTRTPVRIAGSWSVRLKSEGFHTDHVHSQGWISSALYVSLPDQMSRSDSSHRHQGWLSLGESRDIVPGLAPLRLVEPQVGRLVLFPSTMWHGTRPFAAGERLTVAFDIARPQQG